MRASSRGTGQTRSVADLRLSPGIGPVIASALAATIPDANAFSSGRQLAAWIGLVPRQNSSGGKEQLGRITKQGEPYLRRLLVIGAAAVCASHEIGPQPWGRGWVRFVLAGRLWSQRLACE